MTEKTGATRTSPLARLGQPVGAPRRPRLAVGLVPQVTLLPAEVLEAGTFAARRRRLVGAVVLAAAAAVVAVVLATGVDGAASARLAQENARTAVLTPQLGKFDDVRDLQRRIALGRAAVKVGGSTMIDWNEQITDIEASMPSSFTVTSVSAAGATPTSVYPQGSTPLEPRRAATVTLTATTSSLGPDYAAWLRLLRSTRAYADATATLATNEGVTTVTLTVHLDAKAIRAADPMEGS